MLRAPNLINTAVPHRLDLDALLLERVGFRADERVLFVQCGDGWIVEEAWRRARRAYMCGLDTSAALVARATELRGVQGTLEFQLWDGYRIPCPSTCFHRVISTFTLQYCADPSGVLGEMKRALRPGGDLYLLECDYAAGRFSAELDRCGFHEIRELTRREPRSAVSESDAAVIVVARNPMVAAP